jgi:hypothetical protein
MDILNVLVEWRLTFGDVRYFNRNPEVKLIVLVKQFNDWNKFTEYLFIFSESKVLFTVFTNL